MRSIICVECGKKPYYQQQHPEDAAAGMKFRRLEIARVKKPAVHHITINDIPQKEMKTLLCDSCDAVIEDGTPAVAISEWRGGEMGNWEAEYTEQTTPKSTS